MKAFVFPGQGSQSKGMGGDLFGEFKELTDIADSVLGYSIKRLCVEDPEGLLGQTQYTQPALFTVNALSYLKKIALSGERPAYLAGHSLGEYNALFAAGVFDFETGLKLVQKRGELMSRAHGGGMAAVIGLGPERVEEVLGRYKLTSLRIANYNSPSQTVLSGPRGDIERAAEFFEAGGGRYVPLNVSGAFHSVYMNDAEKAFEAFLLPFSFSPPAIPVVSNLEAAPYRQNDMKNILLGQITHPVRWTESIGYLMGRGTVEFEEVGPGNVLTRLIQAIQKGTNPPVKALKEEPSVPKEVKPGMEPVERPEIRSREHAVGTAGAGSSGRTVIPSLDRAEISAAALGDAGFKKEYGIKYAYVTGSMYRGIASKDLVINMGKAGMMGFFGSGGLSISEIERAVLDIQEELSEGQAYGVNLLHNPDHPEAEERIVDLFLNHGVRVIEASAFINISPALVRYRAHGLLREPSGVITARNRVIAKVSRPEIAEAFLSPAPAHLVEKLLQKKSITPEQAELLKKTTVADDLCVEADSGGHTDGGVAFALIPAMIKLRDELVKKHGYPRKARIGAAGGIGTPEAAAAAFIMGADFVLTGSINQCTREAGTSDAVKDMLQHMNVQDTDYAPAGDMFELGAKIQVLKKGVFFPARGNKLYDLYVRHNSLEEIDEKTRKNLQEQYFKRSFEDIFREVRTFSSPGDIEKAERNPKHKMALIFRWYFGRTTRLALAGTPREEVNYQIQCGPALGAFNQWVKGTRVENWRNRHVDEIGKLIMEKTAEHLDLRFRALTGNGHERVAVSQETR